MFSNLLKFCSVILSLHFQIVFSSSFDLLFNQLCISVVFSINSGNPSVFEDSQFEYVQKHLRIISAFYGVLKPRDGVTPYRLEMQTKVGIGETKNLYEYWGDLLYRSVIDNSRILINLASKEYSKCIEKYLTRQDRYYSQMILYILELTVLKHGWSHILKSNSFI